MSCGKGGFLCSTVGQKVVVAITGLIMFGFIVGHLIGNLQVFLGPTVINEYAKFLKETTPLLWGTRITLLVSVFLHFYFTVKLTIRNRASRPAGYAVEKPLQASAASRFMIWTGLFLLFYIVFHILHLTVGVHPNFDHSDIHANIVYGFRQIPVSIVYFIAMVCLGFHLHHGVYSLFQTLGLNHPKYNPWRRCLASAAGWLIPIGYSLIPAAVLLGILTVN